MTVAFAALITFPVHLMMVKRPFSFFVNCFVVLFARKTWVGYALDGKDLPKLRKAILACNGIPASVKQPLPAESLQMMDYWYARNYLPFNDLKLIIKTYRSLGS